jgi:excisionase family DNA binding protein
MSKITTSHLSQTAYVYVRQSTMAQVQHNLESQRRQYALATRAGQLGWERIVVIDEDLGHSGAGAARSGFDKLLDAVARNQAGAVLSIEASRLARNGRDWHALLDFCAIVGTLIIDEDGIYDPRLTNDRLLLGMKGTFSEMELATLRQRSLEARRQKAARGEFYSLIPVGYVLTADNRLEMDPDARVREAIHLVFAKFRELGSARQVILWMRQEGIELPACQAGAANRKTTWRLAGASLRRFLTNPIYAGAYAFGRTRTQVRLHDGRRVVSRPRVPMADWQVLIADHHQGYIDWRDYLHNQQILAENTNMRGEVVRGAVRSGSALLAGLLRCGHCGRRLGLGTSGQRKVGGGLFRYKCRTNADDPTVTGLGCISFGSMRIDRAVSAEVLHVIAPAGLAAALAAIDQQQDSAADKRRQVELALQQARYEAGLARRQYDAVDPDNRLVASELERRWNERLAAAQHLEDQLRALAATVPQGPSAAERARLLALGQDLPIAWDHPAASDEIKKRILRAVIEEIVVRAEGDKLECLIHWKGGEHTALEVARTPTGRTRWLTDDDTTHIITELARLLPDKSIAALLNRMGRRTAKGHTWTGSRVKAFRNQRGIAVYRPGERAERGEITAEEAAEELGVTRMTVSRLVRAKVLPACQVCPHAPYVIRRADLDRPEVRSASTKPPVTADPRQIALGFQG